MAVWYPAKRVTVSTLKYKGIFDYEGMYKMMRRWFKDREYDFWERRYKHKRRAGGAEIEVNWEAWRDITELLRNWIYIYFHIWDYEEVEVIKDGQKKKMAKARMRIEFSWHIEIDYEDRWVDSKLKRALLNFIIKFHLRKELSEPYGDKLWYNCNKLQQETKKFLGMAHSDAYDDMW